MTAPQFPPEFCDLEPYAGWALASERERYAKRLGSSMEELQTFYDAAFPRIDDMAVYLGTFDLATLPDPEARLLRLAYSLINVSFPIEAWRQARVPDSGASSLECIVEPAI